jgi:hypothetical protein
MRTNIPSIDLSHIGGGNNRRDLSDSYVTRVGETTNEDFKELLNIFEEKELMMR